ncbi:hypothetical protein TrCOL_g12924 [Triparma columacea]|uniref:4-hydroxy-tetrahydrodipicolinate synthase n=1 Tax=Triparma columacea TaxID=722753 RepID=A0A9W7LAQ7_9STRA|nr:hypothetical protein TrCOL_g12924 [Triparma columacea]
MTSSGDIDYDSYKALVRWHIEEGTHGLCVLGTTGEAAVMSMEERDRVLKATMEAKGDSDISIIVGTGTINPQTCIDFSKQALAHGADAALVVTPYYVKPTPAGLVQHFKTIAEAVPELPIVLYNVPSRTGCDMQPETVSMVKDACNGLVVGIKEATGDVSRVSPIKSLCGSDFLMWSGDDETGSEFVLQGGDGVISVSANVAPNAMSRIMKAALNGDRSTVEALNDPLKPVHDKLFIESNPIPVKYAMNKMRRASSGIRPPLTELSESCRTIVDDALKSAGVI